MLNKLSRISFGFMIIFGLSTAKVLAHGSIINYKEIEAIEIDAKFDSGNPMANAQVVIYSPSNSTQPWLTGMTDDKGKFIFTPDASVAGNWTVKVRSAGHGSVINIPIKSVSNQEANEVNSSPTSESQGNNQVVKSSSPEMTSSPTMIQKLMMAATGVWGFVGTALFFSRKKV